MEFNGKEKRGSGGSHLPENKKTVRGRGRALRRVLTALGIVALVIIAAIIGYSIWEKPPEVGGKPAASQTVEPSANVGAVPGESAAPDEGDAPEEDEFDGALDTERDDGVYTILLVGRDHESNSTDTILVGRFDTVNHTISAVNIPRDTLANIAWSSTPKKINAVYPGYTNSGKSGIDGLKAYIRNMLGFDIDCYAVVNLKVVEDVINEIGGVYFDVPMDMDYDDGAQHFHVHLKQGYQLLNGYEALGVFRYRYGNNGGTYPGGDIERIGVQQNLLKSIASQMLSLGNIPNLTSVIQLLVDNVETDLTASNMAFFARQFLKCSMDDISFSTMPIANTCYINGISYVSPDVTAWLELVNSQLNPFKEAVTTANVNILTSNGDGSYVTATTGAVAGGADSFFCTSCLGHHLPGACPKNQAAEEENPDVGDDDQSGQEDIGEDISDGEQEELIVPEPEDGPEIEVYYAG